MRSAWKSAPGGAVLMALSVLWTACQSDTTAPRTDLSGTNATAAVSTNGAGNQMPAFYEGDVFTVNMKEMPLNASASTIAHNGNLNEIFATNDLDDEQDFLPVIDAIPGGTRGSIPSGIRTLSSSTRASPRTSSPPKTRFSRQRRVRTRRSPSWRRMRCIAAR